MARVTQIVGAVLVVAGVLAYVVSGFASVTALLPALLGIVIAVLGVVADRVAWGHHAIHAALVVALLGALGSLPRLGGLAEGELAAVTSLVTVLVCAVYIGLGVRSFVAARKARAGEA